MAALTSEITLPAMSDVDTFSSSPPAATRICYFTDKLSAELRIQVYGHVFGQELRAQPNAVPKRPSKDDDLEEDEDEDEDDFQIVTEDLSDLTAQIPRMETQVIHTSIFAVSRLIHIESIEAFYNKKIISISFHDLDRLIGLGYPRQMLRDVEIISCNDFYSSEAMRILLHQAVKLPRLRTFTLLSEYLAVTGPPSMHTTVRQFANKRQLGPVLCTEIGKFSLTGAFSKVTIANSQMLRMWPHVAETPDGFNALEEIRKLQSSHHVSHSLSNAMAWAAHTSLRLWVGMLQRFHDRIYLQPKDEVSSRERLELLAFGEAVGEEIYFPRHAPLHKSSLADDPESLEDITEMLAMTIQTYRVDTPSGYQYRRPHWAELGDESEMSRHT